MVHRFCSDNPRILKLQPLLHLSNSSNPPSPLFPSPLRPPLEVFVAQDHDTKAPNFKELKHDPQNILIRDIMKRADRDRKAKVRVRITHLPRGPFGFLPSKATLSDSTPHPRPSPLSTCLRVPFPLCPPQGNSTTPLFPSLHHFLPTPRQAAQQQAGASTGPEATKRRAAAPPSTTDTSAPPAKRAAVENGNGAGPGLAAAQGVAGAGPGAGSVAPPVYLPDQLRIMSREQLAQMCTDRGLPHSGNKGQLAERILRAQAAAAAARGSRRSGAV